MPAGVPLGVALVPLVDAGAAGVIGVMVVMGMHVVLLVWAGRLPRGHLKTCCGAVPDSIVSECSRALAIYR
jgi:hypothetical protein